MDTGHKAHPLVTQRVIPSLGAILVAAVISIISALVAYGLFPVWGFNSPVLQTVVSSGGVGLGCYVALWFGRRATTV
jgi:hypothetical protein